MGAIIGTWIDTGHKALRSLNVLCDLAHGYFRLSYVQSRILTGNKLSLLGSFYISPLWAKVVNFYMNAYHLISVWWDLWILNFASWPHMFQLLELTYLIIILWWVGLLIGTPASTKVSARCNFISISSAEVVDGPHLWKFICSHNAN